MLIPLTQPLWQDPSFMPWGPFPPTLHLKVKYPFGDQIEKLVRSQSKARQCLVAAILHQLVAESLAPVEEDS